MRFPWAGIGMVLFIVLFVVCLLTIDSGLDDFRSSLDEEAVEEVYLHDYTYYDDETVFLEEGSYEVWVEKGAYDLTIYNDDVGVYSSFNSYPGHISYDFDNDRKVDGVSFYKRGNLEIKVKDIYNISSSGTGGSEGRVYFTPHLVNGTTFLRIIGGSLGALISIPATIIFFILMIITMSVGRRKDPCIDNGQIEKQPQI